MEQQNETTKARPYTGPTWVQYRDGEIAESKIKMASGVLISWQIVKWVEANSDGTFPDRRGIYTVRWWPRETRWMKFKAFISRAWQAYRKAAAEMNRYEGGEP